MIRSRVRSPLCLAIVATVSLIAGGCTSGSSHQEQCFILEAARAGDPLQPVSDGSLSVHRFTVDTAFAAKNMVYRLDEFKYEADYYRQFLISPGVMITEKTRDWLVASGLFRTVLPSGSRVVPAYTLEGNVTALYGDFTSGSAPTAVMEIRFFLVENAPAREKVVCAKTYRATNAVPSRATDDFIGALNRDLTEILTRLEADLQEVLSAREPASPAQQNSQ